jgi:hypothetical protein
MTKHGKQHKPLVVVVHRSFSATTTKEKSKNKKPQKTKPKLEKSKRKKWCLRKPLQRYILESPIWQRSADGDGQNACAKFTDSDVYGVGVFFCIYQDWCSHRDLQRPSAYYSCFLESSNFRGSYNYFLF